jgi:hypothetical protein
VPGAGDQAKGDQPVLTTKPVAASVDPVHGRGQHERVATLLEADYLVVGAGAAGMAFTDALVADCDASVVLVDRRHSVGGHWLDSYPFVRLHQASAFYGVASTLLGQGRVQHEGPEAGLHERATAPEICAYYDRVLRDRMVGSGQVSFYPGCDYVGGRELVSRISGKTYVVGERTRIVDATYFSPRIPAQTPAPFEIAEGARVLPVNDLVALEAAPSQYVVAGSGKTATDACIWLLQRGVDPDDICWVRPRDPWMLNRAVVQPNPAVFIGMAADVLEIASSASSPDQLFLGMEEAGVMLRIDRSVTPTMAKTPTLATWELDLLRTIENVVRKGHIRGAERGRLVLEDGEVAVADDAVVAHCAASGLRYPPMVPIWGPDAITVQPVRTGFPCFGAAIAGHVEATRDDDAEKNRLCPPSPYSNTTTDWGRMQVLGSRASMAFASDPELKAWADSTSLNPARVPPELAGSPEVGAAATRFREFVGPGLARMAEMAGMS